MTSDILKVPHWKAQGVGQGQNVEREDKRTKNADSGGAVLSGCVRKPEARRLLE